MSSGQLVAHSLLIMDENRYVLSVMSSDHPGIVAGVSTAVDELGGSIVSCSQTVLDGYFTFITVIDLPKKYEPAELAKTIQKSGGLGAGFQVIADDYVPVSAKKISDADMFVITAFGKDRPGIVKEFSRYLAGHDINIVDLFGGNREDDFVLIGNLTIPDNVNIRSIQTDLEETGKEYGLTVKVQHNNIFTATNRVRIG
ncbi:amino acid-binding protein [Planctomycetales bacterium]|nr:amino acid-binding protein [Planctomycetales bacterium]